ncbi:LytTR family DNA-binding domain-containing protein [Pedobacter aquatilis]|uniref:LytR/AlgR family response regulator transcription factor n=1 Tax=Pedobacter aquatilis TaxID=351343 RepID=UPI00292DA2E8|nr:LytTR family DNA-binding domain-containing protein [Pedobacter aquatilis]
MDQKISCLIVDDEREAHYVLVNYLKRNPCLVLAAQFYNAQTALEFLEKQAVDLIFLDINMPGLDGFGFLSLLNIKPKVILTTAYMNFALDAFDAGAIDYLVKPIPYPRFEQAIERYKDLFNPQEVKEEEPLTISLKTDRGQIDFLIEDIFYFQSWGNYVKIFFEDYYELCSATTAEIERKLPGKSFIRIHKSYIISLDHLEGIESNLVRIKGYTESLPVGITYRRALSDKIEKRQD